MGKYLPLFVAFLVGVALANRVGFLSPISGATK